jgi:hypothetical protein
MDLQYIRIMIAAFCLAPVMQLWDVTLCYAIHVYCTVVVAVEV